jgi:hypothetical protein
MWLLLRRCSPRSLIWTSCWRCCTRLIMVPVREWSTRYDCGKCSHFNIFISRSER